MILDDALLDDLLVQAKNSERLRLPLDLRTSPADGSQRMLNALQPGTVLPIHRHPTTSEVLVLLRGCLDQIFYDEQGKETHRVRIDTSAGVYGCTIPIGVWHNIEVLAPTIIMEAKDGPYSPNASEFFEN